MIENVKIGDMIVIKKDTRRKQPVPDSWVGTWHEIIYILSDRIFVDDDYLYVGTDITLFEGEFDLSDGELSRLEMKQINQFKRWGYIK
jgi:hypothetical protein